MAGMPSMPQPRHKIAGCSDLRQVETGPPPKHPPGGSGRAMSSKGAAPPPAGETPDFEHPEDVLNTINLVSQILSIAVVTPFVLVRIYTRAIVLPPFLIEDWACVLAWVLSIGYSSTALAMHHFGGGYHVWELTSDKYEGFLKALYADTVVYGPNAYFTKVALLLVIARVFSPFKTTKIVTYVFMGAMLGYYLPVMIIKIQICKPIHGYWDSSVKATCLDQRAIFVADTVLSAITDLAVLLLPIPASLSLRMPASKRLKVWAMLGVGGIATGASFIRMFLVIRLQKSTDQTVDFIRFNLLGTAEVSIGLICACLPAINLLFSRVKTELSRSDEGTPVSVRMKSLRFLRGSNLETATTLTNNGNGPDETSLLPQRGADRKTADVSLAPVQEETVTTIEEEDQR